MLDELRTAVRFLAAYSELLVVTASIYLWESIYRTRVSPDTKWNLYAGAFLALTYLQWRKLDRGRRAQKPETFRAAPPRVFVEDPSRVFDRYGQLARISREAATPYWDQWVVVSGVFEGASQSLAGREIHVSLLLPSGRRLAVRFPESSRDRIEPIRPGQTIVANCQLTVGEPAFALANAEIVRVEPVGPLLA